MCMIWTLRNSVSQLARIACIALLLGLPIAGHAYQCYGTATETLSLPKSFLATSATAVGQSLTPVVSQQVLQICDSPFGTVTIARAGNLSSAPLKTSLNGVTATVYNTNVPGVGIAAVYQLFGCDTQTGVRDLTANDQIKFLCAGGAGAMGANISAALIKTGTFTQGTVSVGTLMTVDVVPGSPRTTNVVLSTSVGLTKTCKLDTKSVTMPAVSTQSFKGIGSTAAGLAFTLGFSDCPSGANAIKYQVDPSIPLADSATGTLALSSSSTAAGVGIQITDSAGLPQKFSQPIAISEYRSDVGGTYAISLRATYRQIAATIQPGNAVARMTYTATYE